MDREHFIPTVLLQWPCGLLPRHTTTECLDVQCCCPSSPLFPPSASQGAAPRSLRCALVSVPPGLPCFRATLKHPGRATKDAPQSQGNTARTPRASRVPRGQQHPHPLRVPAAKLLKEVSPGNQVGDHQLTHLPLHNSPKQSTASQAGQRWKRQPCPGAPAGVRQVAQGTGQLGGIGK